MLGTRMRAVMVAWLVMVPSLVAGESKPNAAPGRQPWLKDYTAGMEAARRARKLLLVYFAPIGVPRGDDRLVKRFDRVRPVRGQLDRYILVRVPCDSVETDQGREFPLLEHAAFAELQGKPGLAIIDMTDPESVLYGDVVSVYPLDMPHALEAGHLAALLDLPSGTLTQRTLIWAVRVRPERPLSADGQVRELLMQEAESHSQYQASIRLQGHHQWERRFHRISDQLPDGLLAQEVCAESWPDEGLIEAAIDCVDSWRQSPGHWSAVSSAHQFYGYDMKCGTNGIWYATGIFSQDR